MVVVEVGAGFVLCALDACANWVLVSAPTTVSLVSALDAVFADVRDVADDVLAAESAPELASPAPQPLKANSVTSKPQPSHCFVFVDNFIVFRFLCLKF